MNNPPIAIPDIRFSRWSPWSDRKHLADLNLPGVYALAHLENGPPEDGADAESLEIIYFGQTCRDLGTRLRQFDQSAFRAGRNHAGGETYSRQFPGDTGETLYVAVFPVANFAQNEQYGPAIRERYIKYIEQVLLWCYTVRWRRPPICNRG